MENKSRDEVVRECVDQVIACWQYYADESVEGDELLLPKIVLALQGTLPERITTWDWRTAAMERKRQEAADEEEECPYPGEDCYDCEHYAECSGTTQTAETG